MSALLRGLPAVDRLAGELTEVAPAVAVAAARQVIEAVRTDVLAGRCPVLPDLRALAEARARLLDRGRLRAVINASGVVVHTNLGRSSWSEGARRAAWEAMGNCDLEMRLDDGLRGGRLEGLVALLQHLTGADDAIVVNNCAAAVLLALTALARDRDVVLSRGELVEIGGSFRMPELMEASGARLKEVGATNRTHLHDYRAALEAGAKVVLKVHRSNFAQVGFVSEVSIEELGALCREFDALLLHDLGMGILERSPGVARLDGGRPESVRRSLDAGAHAVLFSGDKLLGGPQAGIVAGDPDVLLRLRKHPVMRLVRTGKLCLLALEATLRAWELDPSGGLVPVARMLASSADALRVRADALASRLAEVGVPSSVVATQSTPGGGSLPGSVIPSWAVALDGKATQLAAKLRSADPPVVGRIEDDRVLLDVRTLFEGDEDAILAALS